jgi:type I restriction enzyme S subunit
MSTDKNKLIPVLRFPEFLEEGEWEYLNGNKLFEPISNKKHNSDLPILAITQEQGPIPRDMIDYHVSVTDKSIESYKVVEIDDFIISLRSFQGGIEYSNYLGLCSPAYIILRKKVDVINDFYRHYFKSVLFIQDLNKNLEGIRDGKMVSYKQFSDILIPKPTKQEQQKIASCLSSLDEVIAAHSQKLATLKDHKKGLMQNLFPTNSITNDELEITNVPNYRFPEFLEDGEWVEKKLGEVAELTSSKRIHLADYVPSGIPFYRGKEISQLKNNNIIEDILYISEEQYKSIKEKYGVPKIGDILITAVGTLGNIYCIKSNKKFYFKDGNLIWMKNITLDSVFLEVLLDVEKEKVLASAIGSSQKALTMAALNKLEFNVPKNPKEQQKIASCLSSLDDLITAQTEKIAQLKLHKKGLMQGLFPGSITN